MQYGFNYDKNDNNVKTNFLYDLSQAPNTNENKTDAKSKKPSKQRDLKPKKEKKTTKKAIENEEDENNDDLRNDTLPAPYFAAYLNNKNNHQSFIDFSAKKKDEKLKESNSHPQAKSKLDGIFSWMSKTPNSPSFDHQSKLDQIENPAFIICDDKYSKQLEKVQQESKNQKRLQSAASEFRPQSEFGRSSGFPSPPVCKSSMMQNFRYYSDNMSFKSDTLSDTIVFKSASQMPASNLQNPSFLFEDNDENYDNHGYQTHGNHTNNYRSKLKSRISNNKY
jgi:hypothetical protein